MGAFALVCAIAVGGFVWWNGAAMQPREGGAATLTPAAGDTATSPQAGTPKVSEPIHQVPMLPEGWTFVSGTPVPVADAGLPKLPASGTDSRGEQVTVENVDRVVVGGDDTIEIMDSLGMSGNVFGAPYDSTLVTGRDAPETFKFNKDTGPEGILKIEATLFLGNSIRRHTGVVEALAKTKMPSVIVEQNQPAVDKIRLVGQLLGRPEAGEQLASAVQAQLDEAKDIVAARGGAAKPRVIQPAVGGGGRMTVAGLETPPNEMITLAGGINVAAEGGLELYADMSNEGLLAAAPDVILVTVADLETWGGPEGLWKQWPTLKQTPAGKAGRVLVMPDAQLSGGGVATGAGLIDLAKALGV